MIDGKKLIKDQNECYDCGCNLKPVCPRYEDEDNEGNKMKIRVQRLHKNAKLPERAHPTDAGMDLFYCVPPDQEQSPLFARPHGSALFPTGLKIEVPEGYMLEIKSKSGIAVKRGCVVGACVVDRGYTGEIFVNLWNFSSKGAQFDPGDKIAQAVFVKINTDIELVESDHIYDDETSRGDGALGSTGDK
jgi:dUTP pyrophosphatase|tara:strand:+ start:421 stop:987 length:567 start_codon:yes stop_codon:yes gene_type:complete